MWIYGSTHQKIWTQQIYKQKNKFQNPLHQNYKHTQTLKEILNLQENQIFSLVVFVGDSKFKTKMPDNVTYLGEYLKYIKSKITIIFSKDEVNSIITKIEKVKLENSFKTDRLHIQNLKK